MKKSKIGVAIGLSVALSALLSINTAHAENQIRMAFTSPDEDIEITNPLFFSDISAAEQAEHDGEWLKFLKLKTGLDIPSIDDLNYSNIALSLGTQSLNNTLLPSGPLNIQTPYAINLEHNSLTDLDFLRTTTALRNSAYFNDNNLNNVNGLLDLDEALGGLYLQRNQLQQVLGLRKLTHVAQDLDLSENSKLATLEGMGSLARVGQALNLSKNPALVDLTGISDLSTVGGTIYLDNVAQYTETPTAESTFCQSILSGNINIEDSNASAVHFGELCSNVEPWIAFWHGRNKLTSLGALSEWKDERTNIMFSSITNAQLPSTPMLTDTIGSLTLYKINLSNLDFLSNVKHVRAGLQISGLDYLESIDGLSSLTHADKYFYIHKNNLLTNLDGLSSLTNFYQLSINGNDSLTNVDGLSSLAPAQTHNASLSINNNASLTNIDGLSSLTRVTHVNIVGNPVLKNVNGLSSFTKALARVKIYSNPLLTDISGLSNLSSTHGLYIDSPSQYTVKPAIGTPFCEGVKSGDILVKLVDSTVVDYSELCY
jgi:hypothetical protein